MKSEKGLTLSPKMQTAVDELKHLILMQHPEATFQISRSPEERDAIILRATVNVDEIDDVIDLVIDRAMELLIEDGQAIWVVPVRTPERIAAMLAAERTAGAVAAPTAST